MQQTSQKTLGHWELGETIGSGSYAHIRLAQNANSPATQSVAVKCIAKSKLRPAVFLREWNLWRNLQHKNILRALDVMEDEEHVYIFMEYVSGGDLLNFVKTHRTKIPEAICQKLFVGIVEGLEYCHRNHVCHKDIKLGMVKQEKLARGN